MLLFASVAHAEPGPAVLDRDTVIELAREHGPRVAVAERKVDEAHAARTGAGIASPLNPELSVFIGPRFRTSTADYFVGLSWPVDLSGTASRRVNAADERTKLAEAESLVARQAAVADALDLWIRARGAEEVARLESGRLAVDRSVVHAAEVRRAAGTTGDGDLALARVVEAQSAARATTAAHQRDASVARLLARLGRGHDEAPALGGSLVPSEPKPVAVLLQQLKSQPDLVRSLAAVHAATSEATLQRRIGAPIPRFTASTGKDPDIYAHFGVDVPLPVYQRNQTNAAVATARAGTAKAEYDATLAVAEAELRAAYAEYEGARDAFRALDGVTASVDDAEHLALRSYELGQSTLTDLATARREAAAARGARIDAQISYARARMTLDVLTGSLR